MIKVIHETCLLCGSQVQSTVRATRFGNITLKSGFDSHKCLDAPAEGVVQR